MKESKAVWFYRTMKDALLLTIGSVLTLYGYKIGSDTLRLIGVILLVIGIIGWR